MAIHKAKTCITLGGAGDGAEVPEPLALHRAAVVVLEPEPGLPHSRSKAVAQPVSVEVFT